MYEDPTQNYDPEILKFFLGFQVLMYEAPTQYYDPEIHEEYFIHAT